MHLTPEELIDVAEGGPAAPHLQTCEACRHQIVTLRATMSAVADLEVPEPSPLFWAHLSQQVRRRGRRGGITADDVPGVGPRVAGVVASVGDRRSGSGGDDLDLRDGSPARCHRFPARVVSPCRRLHWSHLAQWTIPRWRCLPI